MHTPPCLIHGHTEACSKDLAIAPFLSSLGLLDCKCSTSLHRKIDLDQNFLAFSLMLKHATEILPLLSSLGLFDCMLTFRSLHRRTDQPNFLPSHLWQTRLLKVQHIQFSVGGALEFVQLEHENLLHRFLKATKTEDSLSVQAMLAGMRTLLLKS